MSNLRAERIRKPAWFKVGKLLRGRGVRSTYVIGFDSEAETGRPYLFQFGHPDDSVDLVDVKMRDPLDGFRQFARYLHKHCTRKDTEYIVFGFNLSYEYTQLFRALPDETKDDDTFECTAGDNPMFHVRALNAKRYTFTLEIGGKHNIIRERARRKAHRTCYPTIRVRVIDAGAYFQPGTGLDGAAKVLGIGKKLTKPKEWTRKLRHDPAFIAYAEQDARLTQKLGEYIIALHRTYDVPTCISAPHFAARTFRHDYMSGDVATLDVELEQYGLDSYHGGKNGYYLNQPRMIRNAWSYDIRSAYPEAMRQLPDIEKSEWHYTTTYYPNTHSLWRVRLAYEGCTKDALQHPDHRKLKAGEHITILTGYELDALIAQDEASILEIFGGWVMAGPSGGALVEYVDAFFSMKRTAKTQAESNTAKLFLNSLYGKFYQKQALGDVGMFDFETGEFTTTNPDSDFDYEAGGLYHPPIASLITGFVRAKIHRLEHKYDSLMTSTDGFFSLRVPDPDDLGSELGMLEAKRGTLRIWRERLYLFQPNRRLYTGKDQKRKTALHGWRGTAAQLARVPLTAGNLYSYNAKAMVTLRMSTRKLHGTRYEPGTFVVLPFELSLPGPAPPS
jgi:hypothetical protein